MDVATMRCTPKRLLACLAFAALPAAGCYAPRATELALGQQPAGLLAADFPAPAGLLRGVDPREPGAPWRVGDEVLFGLKLRRAETTRHWLLHLRLLEVEAQADDGSALSDVTWNLSINGEMQSFESSMCRAEVVVMDEAGQELGRSQPVLPRSFLARGIASACELARAKIGVASGAASGPESNPGAWVYSKESARELAEATVTAVALLQIVQEDSVLAPLLWQVIEKPSIWSVVTGLGVNVRIRPLFHRVTSATNPVPTVLDETWRLPIGLEVNDRPALNLDLFVAEPTPPFALSGGMLGATARHPTDPTREFSLLLLSARIGVGVGTVPD